MMASFQLTCRRADNGEVVWKSTDLADYAAFDLVGLPILADGKLFIAGKTGPNPQQPQSRTSRSSSCWRSSRTTARSSGRPRSARSARASSSSSTMYMRDNSPQPRLVVPVGGGLRRHARRASWPGSTPIPARSTGATATRPTRSSRSTASSTTISPRSRRRRASPPLSTGGEAFLIKGMQSDRLYAIDPNRMKVLWERPIAKASRLLGADDQLAVTSAAPSSSAIDLKTRTLLWATRLPGGSMEGRVLVRPDGIWQLTLAGDLRDRSRIGRCAADLPRQGPGRRRAATWS